MSLKIKNRENKYELDFDIIGVHYSLANSLRRIILTEYPTIGFNNTDYINSDIKIINNTSQFHNEFILDRITLLPIHFKEKYDRNNLKRYKFKLDVQNKTNSILKVTTEDIQVIDIEDNIILDSKDFFPPHYIFGTYINIINLQPNPDNIGEILHFEGSASISKGKEHSSFNQISCITFKNKRDPVKLEKALKEHLKKFDESEHKKERLNFELTFADRYFMTDENDEANEFEFYLESKEVELPDLILYNGFDFLKKKIKLFSENLKSIIKDNTKNENIKIYEYLGNMEAYEIEIMNESHTLGNLIQNYCLILNPENLNFISYKNPHPLENKIVFKISTKNNSKDEIFDIINNTCDYLINIINSFLDQISKINKKV